MGMSRREAHHLKIYQQNELVSTSIWSLLNDMASDLQPRMPVNKHPLRLNITHIQNSVPREKVELRSNMLNYSFFHPNFDFYIIDK